MLDGARWFAFGDNLIVQYLGLSKVGFLLVLHFNSVQFSLYLFIHALYTNNYEF